MSVKLPNLLKNESKDINENSLSQMQESKEESIGKFILELSPTHARTLAKKYKDIRKNNEPVQTLDAEKDQTISRYQHMDEAMIKSKVDQLNKNLQHKTLEVEERDIYITHLEQYVDQIKKSSLNFVSEEQLNMQSESQQLTRSNLELTEAIKQARAENFRLQSVLKHNKRIMANELARKQIRGLIKASERKQLSKEAELSLNSASAEKAKQTESTQMPYETFQNLLNFNQTLQKYKTFKSVFDFATTVLHDILDVWKVSLFVVSDDVQRLYLEVEQPEFAPVKAYIGKHIYGHKPWDEFMPNEPKFKLEELTKIIRYDKTIICPVMRFEKRKLNPCYAVLQIEFKKELKGKKRNFNLIDENSVYLINYGLVKSLEVLVTRYESQMYLEKCFEAIQLSQRLCNMKDFRALMRESKEQVTKFMNAEKCQILFYEEVTTNSNVEEIFYVLNEDIEVGDCHLADKNDRHFYKFPFVGVTSESVRMKKVLVFSENPRNDKRYIDDIDNLAGVNNLKNMLFGPIVHNEKVIGVLQLSNKEDPHEALALRHFDCILQTLGRVFHTCNESSFGVKFFENFRNNMNTLTKDLQFNIEFPEENTKMTTLKEFEPMFAKLERIENMLKLNISNSKK